MRGRPEFEVNYTAQFSSYIQMCRCVRAKTSKCSTIFIRFFTSNSLGILGNWVNWQQLSNMELAENAGVTSEKEAFECILDVFTEMCIPDQKNGS